MRPRGSYRSETGSSASHEGRTAGCRPSVTPGTVRHRRAAVTSTDRARVRNGHPPGAPVLSWPGQTVRGQVHQEGAATAPYPDRLLQAGLTFED
jgi:hypothetical protein